jgi:predicted Zn-dependent peptidase
VRAAPTVRHVHREGAQTHVVIGTDAVRHGDPRRLPFLLLSMLLGGGMSSRLFQRVREELGLAYSVFTYQSFHADTGMHGVYVATGPTTGTQAYDAIRAELAEVAANGLPATEIAMGQQQLKGQITLSLESVSARMYRAAAVELYGEPYRSLDELLKLVDAITPEQVMDVAGEFFDPARMTVVSLGPQPVAG